MLPRAFESFDAHGLFANRWIAVALFLCCIALNVGVRLYPAYFPPLKKQALSNVLRANAEKLARDYTGPRTELATRVLDDLKAEIQREPGEFDKKVREEYAKLKDPFQDESGLTYLFDFDPYTWARWTEDIVRHGYPGNILKGGKSFDSMLLAPLEVEVFPYRFLFYGTAFLFKALQKIAKGVSFSSFIFFVPVLYAVCFFAVFFFFVCKRMSSWVAFWAVFSVGFVPMFLMRSSAGWYDFDVLSPLMALLVAWALMESLAPAQRWGRCISFALLAAVLEGAYALVWMGWWFMLAVAGGYFAFHAVCVCIDSGSDSRSARNEFFRVGICACIYFLVAPLTAYVLAGVNIFERFFFLKDFLHFGTLFTSNIWPNAVLTVGEARPLSMEELSQRFYTPLLFYVGVLSMLVAFVREFRTERRNGILLMASWFSFMLVASLQANRFIAYLVIPWGYFFALGIGDYLPGFIERRFRRLYKLGGMLIYLLLIGFVFLTVFRSGVLFAEALRPVMNDPWHAAVEFVEKKTPRDAIINSEWERASWFCYAGKRRVAVDGQFQYTPVNYWMSRVFLEKDEDRALRILRLINNSSCTTYEKIVGRIGEPFLSEAILEKLLTLKESESRRLLAEYHFDGETAGEILRALYATPSPAYLVVDGSLWGKVPSISILGRWDFKKLYVLRHRQKGHAMVRSGLQRIYGVSANEAESILQSASGIKENKNAIKWISRQTPFFVEPAVGMRKREMVHFDFGLAFNLVTKEAVLHSPDGREPSIFRNVVFFEDGEKHFVKNRFGHDDRVALLAEQGDTYKGLITDVDLADSLLVRLLLAGGAGSKYFEPFYADAQNQIFIYKIHWPVEE